MKKLLFLLTIVSISFASCVKEDPNAAAYRKVEPGINIYNLTTTQMSYSMLPTNYAMRLAVLVAEAAKQEKTDLDKIMVTVDTKEVNVKDKLFGEYAKIATLASGDYTITFVPTTGTTGVVYEGVIKVATNGKAQLSQTDQTNFWSVTCGDKFTIKLPANNGTLTGTILGGETTIYSQGLGRYAIQPRNIRTSNSSSEVESLWNAMNSDFGDYGGAGFLLTAPKDGLAYSDCRGKFFDMSGAVGGPTFYSLDGKSATKMMYDVNKGRYIGASLLGGSVSCSLIGQNDYDAKYFVSNFVLFDAVLNEKTGVLSRTITYNGAIFKY